MVDGWITNAGMYRGQCRGFHRSPSGRSQESFGLPNPLLIKIVDIAAYAVVFLLSEETFSQSLTVLFALIVSVLSVRLSLNNLKVPELLQMPSAQISPLRLVSLGPILTMPGIK